MQASRIKEIIDDWFYQWHNPTYKIIDISSQQDAIMALLTAFKNEGMLRNEISLSIKSLIKSKCIPSKATGSKKKGWEKGVEISLSFAESAIYGSEVRAIQASLTPIPLSERPEEKEFSTKQAPSVNVFEENEKMTMEEYLAETEAFMNKHRKPKLNQDNILRHKKKWFSHKPGTGLFGEDVE